MYWGHRRWKAIDSQNQLQLKWCNNVTKILEGGHDNSILKPTFFYIGNWHIK